MTIGEVAAQASLQTSTIRYYEKIGLLAAPLRTSGRRMYQPEVLHRLSIIRFAREIGFTLDEVRLLLYDFPQNTAASLRWPKLAKTKIADMEKIIARAKAMKSMLESVMQCRCQNLEDCANSLARKSAATSE